MTESRAIVLPHVPRYLWIGPGEIWRAAPWLFVVVGVAVPWIITIASRRWSTGRTRWPVWMFIVIVLIVHTTWGVAILSL